MLGYLYWQDQGGEVPTVQSDIMKGTLNVGMAVGQLMFGVLGDALGRHKVYGKELLITLFGTLMVILLPWNNFDKQSIVAWIACFRVVTGIGIGAGKILKKSTHVSNLKAYNYLDYPMSSSLSAESTPLGSRAVLSLFVLLQWVSATYPPVSHSSYCLKHSSPVLSRTSTMSNGFGDSFSGWV